MADVLAVRDDYRAQTWRMLIQECSNSGLTKREFCRRRGISEKSFYYWLRKLRSQMAEAAGPQIVQLESSVTSTEILQIHYRGAELKLPAGVDTMSSEWHTNYQSGRADDGVEDWLGIVAVDVGICHTVGLRYDGTVVAAGFNGYQCDVSDWTDIRVYE